MLKEIGVESYYLSINTTRGGVTANTPPQMYWFNHEIIGIRLPEELNDPTLLAIYRHPTLGKILVFDPTDEITPLGQIRGELQSNYGLLVTQGGGDLILLPQLAPSTSGTRRTARLKFAESGELSGDVTELRRGDSALYQRMELRSVTKEKDRIKPIETSPVALFGQFSNYKGNDREPERP